MSSDVLAKVAAICGISEVELVIAARDYCESGHRTFDNSESYKDVPTEMWEAFWLEWNRRTGWSQDTNSRAPFTCSC